MSITIGKLAKKHGLTRSTLLYYDSIGLLSPSAHVKGEYRHYSIVDEQRLEQICKYRQAGIPLKEIKRILDSPETSFTEILEQRFDELNEQIRNLYEQQRIIAGLLKNTEKITQSGVMTKELWTSLLSNAGFSENDMRKWHMNFEKSDPEKHKRFLQLLKVPREEIVKIQEWARLKG